MVPVFRTIGYDCLLLESLDDYSQVKKKGVKKMSESASASKDSFLSTNSPS